MAAHADVVILDILFYLFTSMPPYLLKHTSGKGLDWVLQACESISTCNR